MKGGTQRENASELLLRISAISVFRGVLEDRVVRHALRLLELLQSEGYDPLAASEAFARLWGELASGDDVSGDRKLLADGWKSRIVAAILDSETVFGEMAESGEVTRSVREQAARDLSTLQRLFYLDAGEIVRGVTALEPRLEGALAVSWPHGKVRDIEEGASSARRGIAEKFAESGDWASVVDTLDEYFSVNGAGFFGRYRAFRWQDGGLVPVPEPDATAMRDLVGYERERGEVMRNMERFARRLPAHHTLLYGPPGTGKSSTVKAVFNHCAPDGVRMVEVAKDRLSELPRLLDVLRGRGLRFIVFVDDLSFEESEVEYKSLKALIEGSIESPPENVRVYATSNRRNLIRESFSEREGDDVHARDTMQEKLSLAARFGLRVTFLSPDQKTYLGIVRGIALERGLKLTEQQVGLLENEALNRERWGQGRSGRAARQTVDDFEAGL